MAGHIEDRVATPTEHAALARSVGWQSHFDESVIAASSAAHRRIYEAIAAGDGDLAELEARDHVLDISRQIALAGERATPAQQQEKSS